MARVTLVLVLGVCLCIVTNASVDVDHEVPSLTTKSGHYHHHHHHKSSKDDKAPNAQNEDDKLYHRNSHDRSDEVNKNTHQYPSNNKYQDQNEIRKSSSGISGYSKGDTQQSHYDGKNEGRHCSNDDGNVKSGTKYDADGDDRYRGNNNSEEYLGKKYHEGERNTKYRDNRNDYGGRGSAFPNEQDSRNRHINDDHDRDTDIYTRHGSRPHYDRRDDRSNRYRSSEKSSYRGYRNRGNTGNEDGNSFNRAGGDYRNREKYGSHGHNNDRHSSSDSSRISHHRGRDHRVESRSHDESSKHHNRHNSKYYEKSHY